MPYYENTDRHINIQSLIHCRDMPQTYVDIGLYYFVYPSISTILEVNLADRRHH